MNYNRGKDQISIKFKKEKQFQLLLLSRVALRTKACESCEGREIIIHRVIPSWISSWCQEHNTASPAPLPANAYLSKYRLPFLSPLAFLHLSQRCQNEIEITFQELQKCFIAAPADCCRILPGDKTDSQVQRLAQ